MLLSRRDLGKVAMAAVPLAVASATVNSRFHGVQIGAITYSFRTMTDVDEIIKAFVQIGLGEVELMSNHAESLAGAPAAGRPGGGGPGAAAPRPPGGGRPQMTPEQAAAMRARAEELRKWRLSVSMDKFKDVRKKFDTAGIDLHLLCFNMNERTTDDEIEYAFQIAKALGVKAITTSTQVTVSKRVAPFADKHKMMVGYHGHDNVANPNEFATMESFSTAMSYSKYNGVNLDIGHFTASNFDAVAYIKEHHARITNLHIKDRKKDHGPNVPWGQGDTPIKDVLQLLKREKYKFPANIEYEYRGEGDVVTEVAKCLQFCKDALA